MSNQTWTALLATSLIFNGLLGLTYRIYRRQRGGPIADVWGQAVLGLVLTGLAAGVLGQAAWARWIALAYGVLFGVVVMPLWVLAVLIPLEPRRLDVAFTVVYWTVLGVTVISAIAA